MKNLNTVFLASLINKYSDKDCIIHITDTSSKIITSSDNERIGTISSTALYVNDVHRAISIANPDAARDSLSTIYGAPIIVEKQIYGTVIVRGSAELSVSIGEMLKNSVETIIEYDSMKSVDEGQQDILTSFGIKLLDGNLGREEIYSSMFKMDMNPELLRCVILIKMSYHQNNYFNIKLNLGYTSGIEKLKSDLIQSLSSNKYLNSQDMVFMYDYNTAVVIKSFIPVDDISRIYLSLDKICESIAEVCSSFKSFSFKMACGSLNADVEKIIKSRNEAEDMIKIGIKSKKNEHFFQPENLLFESVCYYMHPQIINRIIHYTILKLTKKDGTLYHDIIDCAEAYVDSCMNITETAEKTYLHRNTITSRLEKLSALTGLRPSKNFGDAFIIKEVAVYIRQNMNEDNG